MISGDPEIFQVGMLDDSSTISSCLKLLKQSGIRANIGKKAFNCASDIGSRNNKTPPDIPGGSDKAESEWNDQ